VHQEVENAYNEQGTARFQLQKQLQRAFVSHPDSSEPNAESQDPTEPNIDELIEVEKDTPKGKLKAEFGRRRTHNEQVIVYPCGMILLRCQQGSGYLLGFGGSGVVRPIPVSRGSSQDNRFCLFSGKVLRWSNSYEAEMNQR
jgi:hypothetical protein